MNTKRPGGRQNDLSWHPKFLLSYCQTGNVSAGCRAAGIDRHTYYDHVRKFPEFAQSIENGIGELIDDAEAEVYRRAVYGVERIVGRDVNGEPITVRKYSDRLLIFFLKKRCPEVYGDKAERRPQAPMKAHNHKTYPEPALGEYNVVAMLKKQVADEMRAEKHILTQ